MTRRRLALLCGIFFVLRLVLVLSSADRLSQPDGAEVKLMQIGDDWVRSGQAPSLDELLRYARAGTNAPHGAYLLVSLLYALLVVPMGTAGSYLALKLVGIGIATVGLAGWTAAAHRLAGDRAAAAMAMLLVALPATPLGGSMVPWGSHAEAATGLGLCAWIVVSGRIRHPGDAVVAGVALGLCGAASLLVAPMVAAMALGWIWDRRRCHAAGWVSESVALVAAAAAGGGALLRLTGGLSASVTETAGNNPLELLAGGPVGSTEGLFLQTWAGLGDAFGFGSDGLGGLPTGAAAITIGVLLCGALIRQRSEVRGRVVAMGVAAPTLHLVTVCLLAPRRPDLPPRYLLAVWPLLLLSIALAVGWASRRSLAGAVAVIALAVMVAPGAALQVELISPARMEGFDAYRPAEWVRHDIGRVTYEEAPWVNRFLEARGSEQTQGFNFVAGVGASDDPFASEEDPMDPVALLERRDQWLDGGRRTEADRTLLHENIGWSLAVFADDRRGVWHAVLSRLTDPDRSDVARGLGLGLKLRGSAGCAAIGRVTGPDRNAMIEGAAMIGGGGRACQELIDAP